MDNQEQFEYVIPSWRISLRYIWENGIILGREAFSTVYDVGNDQLVVVAHGSFTLGWMLRSGINLLFEVAISEPSFIYRKKGILSTKFQTKERLDSSNWLGIAFDFGEEGFGGIFSLRYVQLETDEFNVSGIHLGAGLRYLY